MLITIAVRFLEVMFVVGAIGSAVVLVLTAIEDFEVLFKKDKNPPPPPAEDSHTESTAV
jgi:hypothetical protein